MTDQAHRSAVLAYVTARCAMRQASDRYDRAGAKAARQAMKQANATSNRAAWPSIDAACGFMDSRLDVTNPAEVMAELGYERPMTADQAARHEVYAADYASRGLPKSAAYHAAKAATLIPDQAPLQPSQDGRWSADRSHMVFDYDHIAKHTGYTAEQVRTRGVSYCRRHPII